MTIIGAAIDATFDAWATPVTYTPVTGAPVSMRAIRYDEPQTDGFGASLTGRAVRFEVRQADRAATPVTGDIINDGTAWKVRAHERRDDLGLWRISVERAP